MLLRIMLVGGLLAARCLAQQGGPAAEICVQDSAGYRIAGATVRMAGRAEALTAGDGCLRGLAVAGPMVVVIEREGFAAQSITLAAGGNMLVTLRPAGGREQVMVTARGAPLALDSSASSVVVLTGSELLQTPGFTLDDRLRQVGGFQLYRRSSSWAANPTSQGVSLRGLGSTASSRTLVVSDEVPVLDPFGSWARWNEIPALAVGSVEAMRGGASDLYGSSAIGGVIDVIPLGDAANDYAVDAFGGGLGTYALDTMAGISRRHWSELAAGDYFHTDGYIPVPQQFRGPVDAVDNLHSQNGRVQLRHTWSESSAVFARMNLLNEARQNGTELQTNATRIWRYATGGDWSEPAWGHALVRVYGSDEDYRQSFSSIKSVHSTRDTEALTRLQRVPTQELGLAARWAQTYFRTLTVVAGADVRDIRGDDREVPVNGAADGPQTSLSARQRYSGVYGEAVWQPKNWSVTLSSRLDHVSTFDGLQTTAGSATATAQPQISETVIDPRLGIVRQLSRAFSFTGSAFRAFRAPTLNELYRTGQVGQTTMLANNTLQSERATGFEFGAAAMGARVGSMRASYFWTEVNRPITNLTISTTGTSITEKRENLGQIRSRGIALEAEAHPCPWMVFSGGYQFAKATVTEFQPDATLVGKWTPEVPRNTFSGTARVQSTRWGSLAVYAYTSGREYDDAENVYLLHGYARFDVEASHQLGRGWQGYVSAQNLLDRTIEVARTPVLSVGTPQVVTVGLRKLMGPQSRRD